MRAAIVALVLIIGAIAVLLLANTLNSWVLGGLIGGLAALVISIPISLTLFVHLSRQHDAHLQRGIQEEPSFAHPVRQEVMPAEALYDDAPEYLLPPKRKWAEDEQSYPMPAQPVQSTRQRYLPAPSAPRLPAPPAPPAPRQQPKDLPAARGRGAPGRYPPPPLPPRPYYPGFPTYSQQSQRSQSQTSALRAARQEAMRQAREQEMDIDMFPPASSRRLQTTHPVQHLGPGRQQLPARSPNTSRQLAQPQSSRQYRPKPTVDATPSLPSTRNRGMLPERGESSGSAARETRNDYQQREPDTDRLRRHYVDTGSIRQSSSSPRTGQTGRNPRIDEQPHNPDEDETLDMRHSPLVRRAPYMYEDDTLREELARQVEAPRVRRTTRSKRQYEEE